MNFFSLRNLINFYIIVTALIFSFYIPPFQKPDSWVHFGKTVAITNLNFGCENKKIYVDNRLHEVYDNYYLKSAPFRYEKKIPNSFFREVFKNKNDNQKKFLINEGCYLNSFSYIYYAFVLKLVSFFPLTGWYIIFLSRFLIFLGIFIFINIILNKYSNLFSKTVILFLLSLPMVVHQLTSFSYDAVLIMFVFLLFIYIIYLRDTKIDIKKLIFLFFLYLGIVLSKSGYEFLILTFFIIPVKNLIYKKSNLLIYSLTFLIILISTLLIRFNFFNSIIIKNINDEASLVYVNSYLITHYPSHFLKIINNTYEQLFRFYIENIIGIFGWLDYGLEYIVYLIFILIFSFIIGFFYKSVNKYKKIFNLSLIQIFFLLVLILGTFIYYITIFYITYSEIAGEISRGIQGRYFIPLIPWVLYLLIVLIYKYKIILTLFIIFILLNSFVKSIYYRYYDYYVLRKSIIPIENIVIKNSEYLVLDNKLTFKLNIEKNKELASIFVNFRNENLNYKYPILLEIKNKHNSNILDKIIIPPNQLQDWQEIKIKKINYKEDLINLEFKEIFNNQKIKSKIKTKKNKLKINKNIIPVYYPN